jgi:hypothetical protein
LPALAALALLGSDEPSARPAPTLKFDRDRARSLAVRAQVERKFLIIEGQRIPPARLLELLDATEPPGPAIDADRIDRLVAECRAEERAIREWRPPVVPVPEDAGRAWHYAPKPRASHQPTPITPGCDEAVRAADAKRRRKAEKLSALAAKGAIRGAG